MNHPPIGIDLGTTNSLIAVFEDGKPRLLANALGAMMTPSVVAEREGNLLVGQAAWDYMMVKPKNAAAAFKRKMGTDAKIMFGRQKLTAPELSSIVLKKLKADAEAELGYEISDVVVTVPAYFNQTQREATQTACRLAGLNPLSLINEPTAAALAYGLHDRDGESQFMIFDLGGGTFDVTVLEHFDGVMEVKASSGDAHLGGEDFTKIIANLFLEMIDAHETDYREADLSQLMYYAEQAKRQLSRNEVFEFTFKLAKKEHKVRLSTEAFETAAAPLVSRLRRPIHRCLYDQNDKRRQIDRVILVGGSTRMPLARRLAATELGLFPDSIIDPDYAVALGAAVQAALIAEDKALDDVVMSDVSPFSVGIDSSSRATSGKRVSGLFSPIIERNTPLPASRVAGFSTIMDNQKIMDLHVYQGESIYSKDNIFLGKLNIDTPQNKAGAESVNVRITYDISGLIEVEATCVSTEKTSCLVLETNASNLDDKDIEKRLQELSHLKLHPRDDEVNIAVLNRLNRLYEMTSGNNREELAQMVVDFESLLETQDPKIIKTSREQLIKQLDLIDEFYVS